MTYGSLSNLTSITDAASNTTQYSYDAAGNLLSISLPDGSQQSFTYDPLGNLSDTIEQNGDPVSYQYNAQGLVTQENFADGTYQTFGYDAHGNLLTAQTYNASGNLTGTTTLTYNAANELTVDQLSGRPVARLSPTMPRASAPRASIRAATRSTTATTPWADWSELTDGSGNLDCPVHVQQPRPTARRSSTATAPTRPTPTTRPAT